MVLHPRQEGTVMFYFFMSCFLLRLLAPLSFTFVHFLLFLLFILASFPPSLIV
jgi:hypothetical protein